MNILQKDKNGVFQKRRFVFDINYSLFSIGGIIIIEQGIYSPKKGTLTSIIVDQLVVSLGRITKDAKIFNFKKNKEFPSYIINNFPSTQLKMVVCEDPIFHIYSPKIRNHKLAIDVISSAKESKLVIIFIIEHADGFPAKLKNEADIIISLCS